MLNRLRTKLSNIIRPASGQHDAGLMNRLMRKFNPGTSSADAGLLYDLPTIRGRSIHMSNNNAIGRGALKIMTTNVVGRGLKVQSSMDKEVISRHNNWKDSFADDYIGQTEARVERLFDQWAESKDESDVSGKENFYLRTLNVLHNTLVSGEVFVTFNQRTRPGSLYGLRLGLIEAQNVHTPMGESISTLNRDGIEVDEDGREVAYWVNRNLELFPEDMQRVPAVGPSSGRPLVLHLFRPERPGQSRGIPFLAPLMQIIHLLDKYTTNESIRAMVSSLYTVFLKRTGLPPEDGLTGAGKNARPDDEDFDFELGPGAFIELYDNEEVQFADPNSPNNAFESFVTTIFRQIGMVTGIPYEILIRQFTSSYSAARGSKVEFWKEVLLLREWLEIDFCRPVYREFFTDCVLSGLIHAPGYFDSPEIQNAWLGTTWAGEAAGHMDPEKEIRAANMKVESGYSNKTQETAEMGGSDFITNLRMRQREINAERKYING